MAHPFYCNLNNTLIWTNYFEYKEEQSFEVRKGLLAPTFSNRQELISSAHESFHLTVMWGEKFVADKTKVHPFRGYISAKKKVLRLYLRFKKTSCDIKHTQQKTSN